MVWTNRHIPYPQGCPKAQCWDPFSVQYLQLHWDQLSACMASDNTAMPTIPCYSCPSGVDDPMFSAIPAHKAITVLIVLVWIKLPNAIRAGASPIYLQEPLKDSSLLKVPHLLIPLTH